MRQVSPARAAKVDALIEGIEIDHLGDAASR